LPDIVGHPNGSPTFADLEERNPSMNSDELKESVADIKAAGVVDVDGDRIRLINNAETQLRDLGYPIEAWRYQYPGVDVN